MDNITRIISELKNSAESNQLFIATVLILLFVIIILLWRLGRPERIMKRNRKRGSKGEEKAKKYLQKKGYSVTEQYEFRSHIYADNEKKTIYLKPDMIAVRGKEKLLVEVKTGASASIQNAKTRRQIREYAACLPGYTYALFDADNMKIVKVEFPDMRCSGTPFSILMLITTFIAGALSAAFIFSRF